MNYATKAMLLNTCAQCTPLCTHTAAARPAVYVTHFYMFLTRMRSFFIIPLFLLTSHSAIAQNLFEASEYRALIADRRAAHPGEVLTVIVLETANAQTGSDLGSGKTIRTALDASYNQDKHEVGFGLRGRGESEAKTTRHGNIKAALTVHITARLPDGTYHISGNQKITINGEQQTIELDGEVRPEDISAQNTVLSTRIANAHITYTGQGSVSDAQKHNHAYKLLSFLGLV